MEVLNNKIIINKGMFNNIDIMENTIESINKSLNEDCVLRLEIKYLKDGNIILFDDTALERLFNLKDKIENYTYEDLEYISKYHIPKLNEIIEIIQDNSIIHIPNYSKKILKTISRELEIKKEKIIIESTSIKTLKFFRKNKYTTCLLIKKKNKRNINAYFKPDIYNLELNLFDNKRIKKIRENFHVIGSIAETEEDIIENKDIYDNLVVENIE